MIRDVSHLLRSGKRAGTTGKGFARVSSCQLMHRRLTMIGDVPHLLGKGKRAGTRGRGSPGFPAAS